MTVFPASRLLAAAGALGCAVAVALGAYAAHATGADSNRLQTASLYLFLHGLALLSLSDRRNSGMAQIALAAMLMGVLLFCGSLIGSALLGWPTLLAPWGGGLLLVAWLLLAVDRLRNAPQT